MHILQQVEPKLVFKHFEDICAIPHGSANRIPIQTHMKNLATNLGLKFKEDQAQNVCVYVPATAGYENKPTVIIQAHTDMVCEKNAGTVHDFEKDGLKLYIDGEWLKAKGTTLGADNGIAVAMMMALMEDKSLAHGPLECLFTVDEEIGLIGANELDPSLLTGNLLINLDTEEEGYICIGCAGGRVIEGKHSYNAEKINNLKSFDLNLIGLNGGHSGVEIDKEHASANKLMGRILWDLNRKFGLRLVKISGVGKHNAISRENFTSFMVEEKHKAELLKAIDVWKITLVKEWNDIEPHLHLELKEVHYGEALSVKDSTDIINIMMEMPHGIQSMSRIVSGLVETSSNFASISLHNGALEILTSQRSSIETKRDDVSFRILSLMEAKGIKVSFKSDYPSWPAKQNSNLVNLSKKIYKKTFNKEAHSVIIHAGLECGIINARLNDRLDMISIGPDIKGAHTPEERVHLASTDRTWKYLLEILKNIE